MVSASLKAEGASISLCFCTQRNDQLVRLLKDEKQSNTDFKAGFQQFERAGELLQGQLISKKGDTRIKQKGSLHKFAATLTRKSQQNREVERERHYL